MRPSLLNATLCTGPRIFRVAMASRLGQSINCTSPERHAKAIVWLLGEIANADKASPPGRAIGPSSWPVAGFQASMNARADDAVRRKDSSGAATTNRSCCTSGERFVVHDLPTVADLASHC